ncbi:leucyl aminopeptidase [Spiroplasma sabaudiense Ar-1343]|uniref:Probable cytosol aminopeptidase n=1 Tax=Spiroplasma sabaudiense Ar-1343 TaxID=1276257 RepID=W6A9E7_9MOLU|nr:M17 family metallopeptidase [Spiroplasma sabaudiense]AHI53606.1 leucyl aminopeptidase [Spiroplasma sabaudiense Ar-1343]
MILLNSKKEFELTLKAIDKKNIKNTLISTDEGSVTLISEDKAFYLTVDTAQCLYKGISKGLSDFFKNQKHDINIDVESFLQIDSKKGDAIFDAIVETAFFENHDLVSYKEKPQPKKDINLICKSDRSNRFEEEKIKMEFVNFTRDLQDTPPNLATSVMIADKISTKAKDIKGLKLTVYNKKQIEDLGMGLLLSVNAGSYVEPRVVVLEYVGDPKQEKIGLVGKGITFDSGGYSLKPSNFMEGMKFDMSGAAIMLSTVMALAKAQAKTNVMAIGLFTDNRIGGHATLVESVIKSMNGKTVEITNTDAEGRLVLADGITYAVRESKVDKIIDAATLTGAIVIALGKWQTGMFSTDDAWYQAVADAAKKAHEPVWRQPLIPEHLKAIQCSPVADLVNSEPGRNAGSSTAAAFLNSFAEGKPFVHLDIAGTADNGKRGTGVMIKTLFELLNKK